MNGVQLRGEATDDGLPQMPANPLKRALIEKRVIYGAGVTMDSLLGVEVLSNAGLDFLFLDLEHGALNTEMLHHMAGLLLRSKTSPVGRVAAGDPWQLKRALDTGIRGVIIPFVNDAAQAAASVRHSKYPPDGTRGLGCALAAARWGMSTSEYVAAANREVVVIAQIETAEAVQNVESIARTPGIDMLFVGPADLSNDLGVPMMARHPLVEDCVVQVANAAVEAGIGLGTVVRTPEEVQVRTAQGFTFLVITGDAGCLLRGAMTTLDQARRATVSNNKHDTGLSVQCSTTTNKPRS